MSSELVLDVSSLEPPEPLERILHAVEHLPQNHYLRVLHRRDPHLLYALLDQRGLAHHTHPGTETAYELLIWRPEDASASLAVQAIIGERAVGQ